MAKYKVNIKFFDIVDGVERNSGDVIDVTKARAGTINSTLAVFAENQGFDNAIEPVKSEK